MHIFMFICVRIYMHPYLYICLYLGQYKDLLSAENGNRKGKLRVGELESDTDDLMVTRDELAGWLRYVYVFLYDY